MLEIKITKEKVLAAAEACPEAKEVLKKIVPEAFEDEWEDITHKVFCFLHEHGRGCDIHFSEYSHKDTELAFGWIYADGMIEVKDEEKWRYKIENSGGLGRQFLRILKKRR